MHFLIIAHDGTDEGAPARRMAARESHLASITRLKAQGKALYGAALTDEDGVMKGSVLIMNYETQEEFDRYLAEEPYVARGVWQHLDIRPCRVPELFLEK